MSWIHKAYVGGNGTMCHGAGNKKKPLEEFYRSGRLVLPLTPPVKRFLEAYIRLFSNQREAAEAAGIDLSTINNYATAYKNMALNVFDRMAEVMQANMKAPEISRALKGKNISNLRALARKQNGAWVDHVMYEINDRLRKILLHYTEPFKSREEAGLALGLNARTYTAYLKGQIQCFPRKYFWLVVEKLRERGMTEREILLLAHAKDWEEFLVEKQRTNALCLSKTEVLEKVTEAVMEGKLKKKDLEPAFLNAINRTFGNFGEAVLQASGHLADLARNDVSKAISRDALPQAIELLNRYGEYYKRCRRSLEFIRRARKEDERAEIDTMLLKFQRTLSQMEVLANQKAQRRNLILVGGVNGGYIPTGSDARAGSGIYRLAKEYSPERQFSSGELIFHGGLGLGEVTEIKSSATILVSFFGSKQETFELAQNRRSFYNR